MVTRAIARERWISFFDSLSRVYAGSGATLEVLAPDLGAQIEVEETPLRGISYDVTGLELHFATRSGHLVHRIAMPARVSIEEGDDGLVAAIEIAADGEPATILRLCTPIASRLLPT
jgi:hypothetical protein